MLSKLFSSKTLQIDVAAPLTGTVVELAQVPDEAFAQKFMGDGFAIVPTVGKLVAPFDGTVVHLIDTHHALIVEHASGLQLLLHIGINTVKLQGEGFKAMVATGDAITSGQPLIEFDINAITAAGYPVITPVVVANHEVVDKLDCSFKAVTAGEAVMKVKLLNS